MRYSALPSFRRFAALVALMSIVSGALAVTPVRAQDATRQAQERACSRDVSRHCRKAMNDGDMAIHQCLLQNRDKLSPSCRKVIEGY